MKGLLVNPPGMVQLGYTPPPLGLLYIAAMHEDTGIYDMALHGDDPEMLATVLELKKPDIVGVPIYTPARQQALAVLKLAKAYGAITVAGGPHVSIMHDQLDKHYPFVDYWVCGDGEPVWEILTQRLGHCPRPGVVAVRRADLDTLPLPAYEKIDLRRYPPRPSTVLHWRSHDLAVEPRVSVVIGRGCDGACTFCSTWWVNGKYRGHSQDWLDGLFEKLWSLGARHLVFQDDAFTADPKLALRACHALNRYNFAWFASARVDHFNESLALAMYEAGCYEVSFGVESGSPTILKRMNKQALPEQALEARDICRRTGLWFTALMIDGFPSETEQTRAENQAFLAKLKPDGRGTLGHTMVLPGTALYQQCKRAGLINDDFWLSDERYYIYRGGLE